MRRIRAGAPLALSALALAVLAAGTGCARGQAGTGRAGGPAGGPAAPVATDAARSYSSVRGYRDVAPPVRIRIPRIGVDSTLERLGRLRDGTVDVPHAWQRAGWYAEGPRPGQPGAAVILGHVDSTTGPAVFLRVRELRAGDRVEVDRADGSRALFRVSSVRQYPKTRFPTSLVYYPTLEPVLRLVTCGGSFDRTVGHYRSNVIAFAALAS